MLAKAEMLKARGPVCLAVLALVVGGWARGQEKPAPAQDKPETLREWIAMKRSTDREFDAAWKRANQEMKSAH